MMSSKRNCELLISRSCSANIDQAYVQHKSIMQSIIVSTDYI